MAKAKFIELNKDQTKEQLKEVLVLAGRNPRYSGKTVREDLGKDNEGRQQIGRVLQKPGFYVD